MTKRYCPNCYNYEHPLRQAVAGWLAWHLVCRPWMFLSRYRSIPPFLATAGHWIYDTRGCGCKVQLVPDLSA